MFEKLQRKYAKYAAGLCLVLLGMITGNVALTSIGASDVVKKAYEQSSASAVDDAEQAEGASVGPVDGKVDK